MTEDVVVLRAKLATLRFWPEAQQMFAGLPNIFSQRMLSGRAVGDIADMLGKDVDQQKIQKMAGVILGGTQIDREAIAALNNDEKTVLVQYLSLYNLMKNNKQQYQQYMNTMLQQSVLGNSQLILFELNS